MASQLSPCSSRICAQVLGAQEFAGLSPGLKRVKSFLIKNLRKNCFCFSGMTASQGSPLPAQLDVGI
jgi:hypothetical protein